jgi:hypothetical protein
MPFGFHLAVDTLPSRSCKRWLQVRLGCVRLSPSCPFRLLHTFLSPGPRGITPSFGYGAPHPSARGTSTLPINALLSAHYGPLRLPARAVPSVIASLGPLGIGCPSPPCRVSQVPRLIYSCALSPITPEGPAGACSLLPPPISGFILSGGLATFTGVTRPNRVRLRYGSQVCFPGFRQPVYADSLRFRYMHACTNEQFTW